MAKVVLKATETTYVPNCEFDGDGNCITTACTVANVATDCAAFPGAVCQDGVCSSSSQSTAIFYVKNFDPPAAFPVPCDGRSYAAEVYGAATGTGQNTINEIHTSEFTMSTACAASFSKNWAKWGEPGAPPLPQLAFPPLVYVTGFPAPYDTYTVRILNLAAAFAPTWNVACPSSPTPSAFTGPTATFPAPTSTAQVTCSGYVSLSSSLLVSGDVPWRQALTGTLSFVPTGGGTIPMP